MPSDARAILRQKTLLGETYVELTPGSADAEPVRRGRLAAGVADLRHGAARRDLPHLRPRDASGVPDLDAGAGARHQRLRARPQRRARQPRAVRRGLRRAGRHPQPPGGRRHEPDLEHGRRVRGADRARRPAALADRELQPRLPGHRVARRAAQGDVHRAADVRARVPADARAAGRVRRRHRPADHPAAARGARAEPDAAGPRRAVARPRGVVPRAQPADRRVGEGLPGGRAGARGRAAADRPARPGDAAAGADRRLPRPLQARADRLLRATRRPRPRRRTRAASTTCARSTR